MPFHDFACKDCKHVFEVLTRSDTTEVKCEKCASLNTEKQVCAPRGFTGDMPGRNMKWDRHGDKNLKAFKKEYGYK